LKHANRSLEDFSTVNSCHGQFNAHSAMAISRYFLSQFDLARQSAQAGTELAERMQAWRMLGYLHAYRAHVELAVGHLDQAIEHAELAVLLGDRYSHAETSACGLRVIGDLFSWLEDMQPCVRYYQHAMDTGQNQFLAVDQQFRLGLALV
jgi:hypothetical protein